MARFHPWLDHNTSSVFSPIINTMALYEVTPHELRPISGKSLAELQLRERKDIQPLILQQIEVLDPDLYVITEEFGDWEDSRRRIDILAIDRDANLVVIELKRDDGAHMELQAIRYASMVSTMTFDKVVETHSAYLGKKGDDASKAEENLLTFLDWSELTVRNHF